MFSRIPFKIVILNMSQFNSLEKFGILAICVLLYNVVKFVCVLFYRYILGPATNNIDFKSKGKWAIVTGSTDGIGKEFAKELAARGCDIVLISRSIDKLKATASEIENEYKVNTKIIQADFAEGSHIYKKIREEIADLEVGTLVNNVGTSYAYAEYLLDLPDWDNILKSLINVNILSVTEMTRLVLPDMVKRQKGVIVNVGSTASVVPCPMLTIYGATKAYMDKFTECLEMEYSKHNITMQYLEPGIICSKMSGITESTFFVPTAKTYVKSAIRFVGIADRTPGYIPHAIYQSLTRGIYSMCKPLAVSLTIKAMMTNFHRPNK